MATIIGLPKLSPTMEEGVLAKWLKKEGDKVSPGDVIAEVETDKANMDFVIEDEGTLLKLIVKEGDTVKLGGPVAVIGEKGEDFAALLAVPGAAAAPAPATAEKPAAPVAAAAPAAAAEKPEKKDEPPAASEAPAATPPAPKQPASVATPASPPTQSTTLLASPLAKTLAAENGVDLRTIKGTGPGGRIVERDVRSAMSGVPAEASAAPAAKAKPAAPAPAPFVAASNGKDVDKPLSLMRKTIAKRLLEAKQSIPHFYLTSDCDAAPLIAFRAAMNVIAGDDAKVSVNDLIIKAAALALRRLPMANASWMGDSIRIHGAVHIGVAVSIEDGLVTPVIRDADQKGAARIAAEMRDLATRARARKLMPEEMTGSTFTVSNLGMFGIDEFKAIINPPEAVILAAGAVKRRPVIDTNGNVVAGERMTLSLSCDHRVVDGVLGAKLLAEIVKVLEHPAALAL